MNKTFGSTLTTEAPISLLYELFPLLNDSFVSISCLKSKRKNLMIIQFSKAKLKCHSNEKLTLCQLEGTLYFHFVL